ncbi:metal ABC transporter ATP-binding protein [Polyangium spumosum]|uniref:ATP-binding cassette domain-containing protein n=1 Tax=Polyangium spumosum TaxID=889282 RepID=A0A6N7PXZ1_9BACT|nr:ATP-binding cassette domain-containing protein [Polyangium spumosum]MRG96873.1 ATP-binding cassette domain-containing protein [Polyangium spumosum]
MTAAQAEMDGMPQGHFTLPDASLPRVLEVEDLVVDVPGRRLLDEVSFWVPKGEFVCLCGPNGAGKSTFLKAVLGLMTPTSGSIRIMGKSAQKALRDVGYVPQRKTSDMTFPARSIDLIVAAMRGSWPLRIREEERARAIEILRHVGGERLLEKEIARLSGGETQRVFLARALVNEPSLVILDEPTAGVDVKGRAEFLDLLAEISASDELAAILVTHNLAAVARCAERVVYLDAGRVSAWGLPSELLGQASLSAISAVAGGDHAAHSHHHHLPDEE